MGNIDLIAPGEAILFEDPDSAEALLSDLMDAGFKNCVGQLLELKETTTKWGVRWWPEDQFPNCISYLRHDGMKMLLDEGCLDESYIDHGYRYRIRHYTDCSIDVDDLL